MNVDEALVEGQGVVGEFLRQGRYELALAASNTAFRKQTAVERFRVERFGVGDNARYGEKP